MVMSVPTGSYQPEMDFPAMSDLIGLERILAFRTNLRRRIRSSLNGEIGNLVAGRKPVTGEIGMGRSVAVTLISVSSSADGRRRASMRRE
jgi:hypothetical protein